MSFHLVNRPKPLPREYYTEAVDLLGRQFALMEGVKTMFTFGNVTTPGISDLDILLVFEDGLKCELNGFEKLHIQYRPLFTHRIMALCETHFVTNNHFTLWGDHKLIFGNEPAGIPSLQKTKEQLNLLKRQTAIEFLVANYIDLHVMIEYGVIKLRSFLQHMKGLLYDLDFLGIKECELNPYLYQLKEWILNWFSQTPKDKEIVEWIKKFIPVYDHFVNSILKSEPVYFPEMKSYQVAKNMQLIKDVDVSYHHKGIVLPSFIALYNSKFNKIQNRLNSFNFHLPITNIPSDPILEERFSFTGDEKLQPEVFA